MKKGCAALTVTLACLPLILPTILHATIINIDSYSNNILNPVVLSLDAGTYTLKPVGVAEGGAYNAYSLHDAWPNTWVWWYVLSSTELGEVAVSAPPAPGGGYYATEMDAFAAAAAASYTFALTHADNVSFWIHDGPKWMGI